MNDPTSGGVPVARLDRDGNVSGWPARGEGRVAGASEQVRRLVLGAVTEVGREGAVGTVGYHAFGGRWRLTLRPAPGGERVLVEEPLPRTSVLPPLLTALRRGSAGPVAHAVRSPAVRLAGAVTLARRAAARGGHAELQAELDRVSDAADAVLTQADRLAAMLTPTGDAGTRHTGAAPGTAEAGATPADEGSTLLASLSACGGTSGAEPGERRSLAGRPVAAVVVVPRPSPALRAPLERLVTHLRSHWWHAGISVLAPGAVRRWDPTPDASPSEGGSTPWPAGDPAAEAHLARRFAAIWSGDGVAAVEDLAMLEQAGVGVMLTHCSGAGWSVLEQPLPTAVRIAPLTPEAQQLLEPAGIAVIVTGVPDP
jgi:hypothetical protein